MILSEKIAEERKKNGWSQEELAEKLSVSRQAVSKWESAQSVPDLQRVLRMAEIFGVSTDYLLKDEIGKEEFEKISDYRTEDTTLRNVSMEEANRFLEWKLSRMEFREYALGLYLDSVAGSGSSIRCSICSCKRNFREA